MTDFPEPFKWEPLGAAIAGTISAIRKATFDGKDVPELWIITADGERSVLCGQANLLTQLLDLKPEIGDRIAIKYVSQAKAKLGMAKLFEVAVKRADETFDVSTFTNPHASTKSAADLL